MALDGMVSLVATGQRTRDDVIAYILPLFQKLERNPGVHWEGLANVCADLWPQETFQELRRAYEDGLVDTASIDWQDLDDALMGKQATMQRARYREPLITDMAEAMGWMQCFHNSNSDDEPQGELGRALMVSPSIEWGTMPIRRNAPKVGRNEPCPCGSGKKFKKCCGSHSQQKESIS